MYSIFLSHSHSDKSFAKILSDRLQAYGIITWIDDAEIEIGDSLISKIEEAIQDVDYLGVILSPDSVSSEWVRREVQIALTEEIRGRKVKVLPLLYKDCSIPGFLIDKIYADFSNEFEEGFAKLLHRLTSSAQEKHKHKKALKLLQSGYIDWLNFSKDNFHLLDEKRLEIILRFVNLPALSINLLEFLLNSLAYIEKPFDKDISKLHRWLANLPTFDINELIEKAFSKNQPPKLKLYLLKLSPNLIGVNWVNLILNLIENEKNINIRRTCFKSLFNLKHRLPSETAKMILKNDEDWVVQSYVLLNLESLKSCLLISDGTEFAEELGIIANEAGYRIVTSRSSSFGFPSNEVNAFGDEIFRPYELIILVRGEHFTRFENEELYSRLRKFVYEGGILFATAWVHWESKDIPNFTEILPFTYKDDYFEKNWIIGKPSTNKLAKVLFNNNISFFSSYELLEAKNDSTVLFETNNGIPLLGFRKFGKGTCYYFNTCQHICLGDMKSPLGNNELNYCIRRVFSYISKRSMLNMAMGEL